MVSKFRKLLILIILSIFLSPLIASAQENADILAFKKKLDGAWIRKDKNKSELIINYNRITNEIIMFSSAEGTQEVYLCSAFSKTKSGNSYYLVGTNDMVPFIKANITIRMDSDNSCWFTVRESEIKNADVIWTGSYTRMTSYDSKATNADTNEQFIPVGKYSNDSLSIEFTGNSFTFNDGKETKSGIFAVYDFEGINIIELRYLSRDGKQIGMTQFKIENKEDSITLSPGKIKVHGFKPSGEQSSVLTKASSEHR